MEFEWDENKNQENIRKHDVSFFDAQNAFFDGKRIIALDTKHTTKNEKRYFCFGLIEDKIMTVRFTVRRNKIRIFGAGYWREGKKRYEKENNL